MTSLADLCVLAGQEPPQQEGRSLSETAEILPLGLTLCLLYLDEVKSVHP